MMCFKTLENNPLVTKNNSVKSLIINDYEIQFNKSIDEIDSTLFSTERDIFLTPNFLKVLENAPPKSFQFCYLTFFHKNQFVGFMACEIKHFKTEESLNLSNVDSYILLAVRKWLAKQVNFQTLIVGNLLLTGEHSYHLDNSLISEADRKFLMIKGIKHAKKMLSEENIVIKSVFIKDFFESQFTVGADGTKQIPDFGEGYNEFQVEPNFIFDIQPEWRVFDDYLKALASKYRVRAKRAFKKLEGIEKKEFNEERIIAHKLKINELYQTIRSKSAFNLVDLHEDYFIELKRRLEDKFRLFGYFSPQGELVGFYSTIDNGAELDAHYLGYEAEWNYSHQIYLNFLFDIVQVGIETGSRRIIFGRTANEIKSSIGAVAHEMYLYMRHENTIINRLLPYFLRILKPREIWLPRQPFKENSTD